MTNKKIIFALPGNKFSGNFLSCWTELLHQCQRNNISIMLSQTYSSNVYQVRNKCLGGDSRRGIKQKPFNGEIDYDYIMWIDSDIYFRPEQFFKLLEAKKDIISGLYMMDDNTHYATVEKWDEDFYLKNGHFQFLTREDIKNHKKPFKVDYTGFGWMLIKKGVFESLDYPWFNPLWTKLEHKGVIINDYASEDASFCMNIQEKGYDIWIDPTVIVGHEKNMVLF